MNSKKCKRCGKAIKPAFEYCWSCEQRNKEDREYQYWLELSEDEKELQRDIYYSNLCSMCGKEGADLRPNGDYFCGTCWSIWNS